MEHRLLGGSGFKVPVLGLGTATFGGVRFFKAWGDTDVAGATRLVDLALEAGANLFDTADMYSDGLAEEILGRALQGRRNQAILSTKATFRAGPGPNDQGSSRHHLIQACEASLRRLGVDHIDIYHMHGFDALTPVEETLRALDDLVTQGKVRYLACSNFSGWHLMKSLAVSDRHGWSRYVVHQAYYSLLDRDFEWELMPLGLDQRVGTLVWSPLTGGLLTGKVKRGQGAPEGTRAAVQGWMGPGIPEDRLFGVVETLEALAGELGRSPSQVALNWLLRRPTVVSVILGARREEQLKDNLQAAQFTLTPEQVRRLDEASARPAAYPYWHQRSSSLELNPPPVPLTHPPFQ